ncbi:MAG: choice-of-anchor Q domain-containing protein, partial [Alcanivoracaceae bacterium]
MEELADRDLSTKVIIRWRWLLAGILLLPGLVNAATLTVDSAADTIEEDDFCTLREAVINANNNDQSGSTDCTAGDALPTVDVISFSGTTNGVPIVLSLTGADENAAATGDLDITESVIINGNGASAVTTVDGNGTDRVFEVRNAAEVQMLYLTVTNGGAVTVGAGVRVFSGTLEMQDARVSANTINAGPSAGTLAGAGIYAQDYVRLTRVAVEDNSIDALGDYAGQGAGISVATGGEVELITSLVRNNAINTEDGSASGAGLYNAPNNAGLTTGISSSIFDGNEAVSSGDGGASGGAINHQSGTLSIVRGVFSNNLVRRLSDSGAAVASGGAIAAFDPVTLRNSTVSGNTARSVEASWGGGLSLSDVATLNNVTITNNTARLSGAGSTLGGGLRGNSQVEISNSVVAGNTTVNGGADSPDCYSTITSAGYNLIGDNTGCTFVDTTGDQVGDVAGGDSAIDARLAVLAAYGSSISIHGDEIAVLTHAPLPDSPLIDTADPNTPGAGGTCESLDQIGYGRPIDGDDNGAAVCDIGSVEYSTDLPSPPSSGNG